MIQIDFKLKNKSGIYSIFNLCNGKRYIGSSIDLYNRLHEHYHNLKNNKAHNKHLQSSWNKYTEEYFQFNILEYCEPELRFNREQYYLDILKPEYNFSQSVIANIGRDLSKNTRDKISNTLKEKYKSGELTPYIRKDILKECWIYNINTWTLFKYCKTYVDAADAIKVHRDTISSEKIKNRIYCGKYIIVRQPLKFVSELKNLIFKEFFKAKTNNTNYIITEDSNGELMYYRSYSACSKIVGNSAETLRNHINSTKQNPYITKSGLAFYTSLEYIPLKETAVPIEKSSELLSGNIGESSTVEDNTEINLETKESKSSYSVGDETI